MKAGGRITDMREKEGWQAGTMGGQTKGISDEKLGLVLRQDASSSWMDGKIEGDRSADCPEMY